MVIKDNKALLVRHGEAAEHVNGAYGLPAGRIQGGESDKETACRELKEETGLDADPDSLHLLSKVWRADIERKDGVKQFSLTVFLADKFSGQLSGNGETTPEWIGLEDIENHKLLPNVKEVIEEGLSFPRAAK